MKSASCTTPSQYCGDANVPVPAKELLVSNGLYLGVCGLLSNPDGYVGYSAKRHTPLLHMTASGPVDPEPFWEPVQHEAGDRLVLDPRLFYLLMSDEAVRISS